MPDGSIKGDRSQLLDLLPVIREMLNATQTFEVITAAPLVTITLIVDFEKLKAVFDRLEGE